MKKEELVELGLDEEQIAAVFKMNGLDVENAKADVTTKETELADTKKLLEDANEQIDNFKDLDVDGIKAASEDYKQKYEQAQEDAKAQLESVRFEHELEGAIRDSKAKNVTAAKALLDIDKLKSSTDRTQDIKAAIDGIRESNDYLFESNDPQGTGGSLGNTGNKNKGTATMSKEDFRKMGYKERRDLKQKDADLYDELSK